MTPTCSPLNPSDWEEMLAKGVKMAIPLRKDVAEDDLIQVAVPHPIGVRCNDGLWTRVVSARC